MFNIKRKLAVLGVSALTLVLAGCHVAVPGESGNKVHRDGGGNVTMLEYGNAFLVNLYDGDLDNKCYEPLIGSGADLGTPNSGSLDPPNSIVVNCMLDELTYDENEDPADDTVSLWCEVDDCGNEEETDRVIHDATDFLHTYAGGSYALAEQWSYVVRDSYDAGSGRCIFITGLGAFEDDCT